MPGGRPEFEVTDELRTRVAIAAGAGMTHEEIAIGIGCSRPTLEKHFELELSEGAYAKRLEVLEAMHAAAVKGNVTAAREYLARTPRAAAPPDRPDKPEKRGKKDQANVDARTAATGTDWADILPRAGEMPQ